MCPMLPISLSCPSSSRFFQIYVYFLHYVPFSNKDMVQQTTAFQIYHLCSGMAGTSFIAHLCCVFFFFKPISHKSLTVSYHSYKNGQVVSCGKMEIIGFCNPAEIHGIRINDMILLLLRTPPERMIWIHNKQKRKTVKITLSQIQRLGVSDKSVTTNFHLP